VARARLGRLEDALEIGPIARIGHATWQDIGIVEQYGIPTNVVKLETVWHTGFIVVFHGSPKVGTGHYSSQWIANGGIHIDNAATQIIGTMWYVGYRGICCTVVELLLPNRRCMVVWSVLRLLVLVVLQKDTGIIVDEMVVLPPTLAAPPPPPPPPPPPLHRVKVTIRTVAAAAAAATVIIRYLVPPGPGGGGGGGDGWGGDQRRQHEVGRLRLRRLVYSCIVVEAAHISLSHVQYLSLSLSLSEQ
jgi:hypothetical protein